MVSYSDVVNCLVLVLSRLLALLSMMNLAPTTGRLKIEPKLGRVMAESHFVDGWRFD